MTLKTLKLAIVLASLVLAGGAHAQSVADQVVSQLKQQGYARITVSNTLLGRVRISAESDDRSREIVVNPRTGEILRDYWQGRSNGILDDGRKSGGGASAGNSHGKKGDDGSDDSGDDSDDDSSDDSSDDGGDDSDGDSDGGHGGGSDD